MKTIKIRPPKRGPFSILAQMIENHKMATAFFRKLLGPEENIYLYLISI